MSLLDMDQRLLELADKIELVYSPLVDAKEFPENVDVTLVEGSISNEENLEQIRRILRENQTSSLTRRLRRNRQRPINAERIQRRSNTRISIPPESQHGYKDSVRGSTNPPESSHASSLSRKG